jgi:hypothetical protein
MVHGVGALIPGSGSPQSFGALVQFRFQVGLLPGDNSKAFPTFVARNQQSPH